MIAIARPLIVDPLASTASTLNTMSSNARRFLPPNKVRHDITLSSKVRNEATTIHDMNRTNEIDIRYAQILV